MIRQLKYLGGLLLAGALVACGGGGGSAGTCVGGTSCPPTGGTATPAAIDVFSSTPVLSSTTDSSVSFTVVVKDANNQAIPNQTVTFSASSGNLVGALPSPKTGASGEAVTTVSLTPGADRTNRDITVTVTAGGATRQIVVPVSGTTVSLSGDSSLLLGNQSTFTVRALDAAGQPVPNAIIQLSSSLGNGLSAQTVTTNSTGAATFTYTGTRGGVDTITATGLGATVTSSISVSSDAFQFVSPGASTTIPVGETRTVTISLQRNGAPVVGQTVTFSTTRGTITPVTAGTDSQGRASAVVSSTSSGPATIVAQVPTAQVSLSVNYIATQAATIVVQANPGAVPPNTGGSKTNQSTIVATVRDAVGNPVAGQVVNFTLVTDGSNGSVSPGSAVTDASGNAQTLFIPGGLSTANNGVRIQATVAGTSISGIATVTVNAQALFISIATSNEIGNLDAQTYQKEFSVYVTDANGAPAVNRTVNLEVYPVQYYKGSYSRPDGADQWTRNVTATCVNEDVNRNGILDAGEDTNTNGRLDPGLPVVVTPSSVLTGANGFATFKLQYGENYAGWVDTIITARTSVGGTESVKQQAYFLFPSLPDMTSEGTPANVFSPFGSGMSCTSPN
jgi:hypothetical protein